MNYDPWPQELRFTPMTLDAARRIADTWKYHAPHDFYNATADPDDYLEFITPEQWPAHFWQAHHDDQLVGFFAGNPVAGEAAHEISLGLRPDLTGGGRGAAFLGAGLEKLLAESPTPKVILSVAAFNERAIKVYGQLGFQVTRRYRQPTNGDVYDFVEMELSLDR